MSGIDQCSSRQVVTVTGPVPAKTEGAIDAHGHVWIEPDTDVSSPRLSDYAAIRSELSEYRRSGGAGVVDCQPAFAGRSARRLVALAQDTALSIVAATGFHLPSYYASSSWIWSASLDQLASFFIGELRSGMRDEGNFASQSASEAPDQPRAGVIKAAFPGDFRDPRVSILFEAVTAASRETGVALTIHTEKGAGVETLAEYLLDRSVTAERVVLCHLDKRPDAGLHRSLARQGFLLEYDTFTRPKYQPERFVWPLLEKLLGEGYGHSIACGLDLADASQWAFASSGEGMSALTKLVVPRLRALGASPSVLKALTGQNIWSRLAA